MYARNKLILMFILYWCKTSSPRRRLCRTL